MESLPQADWQVTQQGSEGTRQGLASQEQT